MILKKQLSQERLKPEKSKHQEQAYSKCCQFKRDKVTNTFHSHCRSKFDLPKCFMSVFEKECLILARLFTEPIENLNSSHGKENGNINVTNVNKNYRVVLLNNETRWRKSLPCISCQFCIKFLSFDIKDYQSLHISQKVQMRISTCSILSYSEIITDFIVASISVNYPICNSSCKIVVVACTSSLPMPELWCSKKMSYSGNHGRYQKCLTVPLIRIKKVCDNPIQGRFRRSKVLQWNRTNGLEDVEKLYRSKKKSQKKPGLLSLLEQGQPDLHENSNSNSMSYHSIQLQQTRVQSHRKVHGSLGKWSEWWTRIVIMVAVWTCLAKCHVQAFSETNICQEKNIAATQICGSMDLRNDMSTLEALCKCKIINGYLHFVLQEQRGNDSMTKYSFPGLREITHHLLIYRVINLKSLKTLFPNLAVIRGDVLFHNYALIIYAMPSLEEVGLVSLTAILRGSVRIEKNPRLCYVHTIDWNNITVGKLDENYINRNRPEEECPACPEKLQCQRPEPCVSPKCWGPDDCQIPCGKRCFSKCYGKDCCHEECVGGCTRPNDPAACNACRTVVENGRCVSECSANKYKVQGHHCEDKSFCIIRGYVIKNNPRECLRKCLSGYKETVKYEKPYNVSYCERCEDCRLECPGHTVRSVHEAQMLRACKVVKGKLTININGGEAIQRELEENLGGIEEVTKYVKIFRSNVTSLHFLRNLTKIGGEELIRNNYSLEILDNPILSSLFNWSERSPVFNIVGKVFAQSNPKLCVDHIHKLINKTKIGKPSEEDVSLTSNGDKTPCNVTPLRAWIKNTTLYGTISVGVEIPTNLNILPPDTNYYYQETQGKEVSLYENKGPCSAQGWTSRPLDTSSVQIMSSNETRDRTIHFDITNLKPFTQYAIYIKTHPLRNNDKSAQSKILYSTTRASNPTKPESPQAKSLNSSSLDIWWDPPRRPNGIVDHYIITVTLLDKIPRIPEGLDFCNKETQQYMDRNPQQNLKGQKTENSLWNLKKKSGHLKDIDRLQMGAEDSKTCRTRGNYSCCTCQRSPPFPLSTSSLGGNKGYQEVIDQIQLEDFIIDNIYVKKSSRSRMKRNVYEKDTQFDPLLFMNYKSDKHRSEGTNHLSERSVDIDKRGNEVRRKEIRTWKEIDGEEEREGETGRPSPSSGITAEAEGEGGTLLAKAEGGGSTLLAKAKGLRDRDGILAGPAGSAGTTGTVQAFPVHKSQTVMVFPSQEGIQANYVDHIENLSCFDIRDHTNPNVLVRQMIMTNQTRYTVNNLRHFGLHSIEIVACHKALYNLKKLCSSIPARIAVFTQPKGSADMIEEQSLKVLNTSSPDKVEVTWNPPKAPNGEVLAYLINLQIHERAIMSKCVSNDEFESRGRRFPLDNLSPGNYSLAIQVRSENGKGNFSSPVTFVIPDNEATSYLPVVFVSCLLLLAGVLGPIVVCLGWRRYQAKFETPKTIENVEINPHYQEGFAPADDFHKKFIFCRDDLKVFHYRPLGQGHFGTVFEGDLRRNGQHIRVAVKTHHEKETHEEIKQFLSEAKVMQEIKCHHVVELLGVVGDYAPVFVIMELMQEGDLKSFLKKHAKRHNQITQQKLIEMAVEAADGMAYLSANSLVHRDLAARNCMLNHKLTLKIGDFGLTRKLKSDYYYKKVGHGDLPVRWMAPENHHPSGFYTTQSDVWSYGVLLWEMATMGDTPYGDLSNEEVIHLVVEKEATPNQPQDCPTPLAKLMKKCWKYIPSQRPSFIAITKFLLLQYTSLEYQSRFEHVSFYHERCSDYSKYEPNGACGFMTEILRENEGDESDDIGTLSTSDSGDDHTAQELNPFKYDRKPSNDDIWAPRSYQSNLCNDYGNGTGNFNNELMVVSERQALLERGIYPNDEYPSTCDEYRNAQDKFQPLYSSGTLPRGPEENRTTQHLVFPKYERKLQLEKVQVNTPIFNSMTPSTISLTPTRNPTSLAEASVLSLLKPSFPFKIQSPTPKIPTSCNIYPQSVTPPHCSCPKNILNVKTSVPSSSVVIGCQPSTKHRRKASEDESSAGSSSSSSSVCGHYYNVKPSLLRTECSSTMALPPTPSRVGAIQPFSIGLGKSISHDSLTGFDIDEDVYNDDSGGVADDSKSLENYQNDSEQYFQSSSRLTEMPYVDKSDRRCSFEAIVTTPLTTDDSYLRHHFSKSKKILANKSVPLGFGFARNTLPSSSSRKSYENARYNSSTTSFLS